ncbi:MAG: zinc-dependent metalloprotease [Flavobacteriaceae bacterium]|nr:zinc-dependent metalloprotease [Flavobacteriaceae bacterium]
MKKTLLLFISIFISFSLNSQKKSVDSLTKKMTISKGIINSFTDNNKLFFEIPNDLLNKEILVVTRLAQVPSGYSPYINAGSKTSEQVVSFFKKNNRVDIKQISFNNIANEEDPINQSVTENNFSPILASFEIKNDDQTSLLIDVSDYFLKDSPGFNIINPRLKDNYKIGSVDKKRSSIDSVKSFPKNIEVLSTLTFNTSKPPRANRTKTFSFQVNHSFILLPDDKMKIRNYDHRVGWFTVNKIDYSSDALKSDSFRLIRRWKLEPNDEEAYLRGELVEPKKQIIYFLDPATPKKWRPYFIQGIEDWNSVFEKAGFKNAIVAKNPPTKEEDPDFSPEDIRYSTVRYVASETRNATGPSVSDPRTGEILESDIIWYHNHLRSYRNRYLLETGAANPSARTLNTPEKEIGEMMRRVISHEIGHALGLPHNMKASSAYPVESLRSGEFTQKMGIATTIMDYARYNYVAQPGDENIRFVRQLGPYDDYSIEWGYRYYPNKTVEEEKEILSKIVDQKSLDPIYMFGSSRGDPNSQTENIGDNPVIASSYGLKNLKIVSNNLIQWTYEPGKDFSDLEELYDELLGVYRRYIFHVIGVIGGVNQTLINTNQDGSYTYVNVNKHEQIKALDFLDKELWATPLWLLNKDIISQFNNSDGLYKIEAMHERALNSLLSSTRLNRMLSSDNSIKGDALKYYELFDNLFESIFQKVVPTDQIKRNLQISFTKKISELITEEDLKDVIKSKALSIKQKINKISDRKSRSSNADLVKDHYNYLVFLTNDDD